MTDLLLWTLVSASVALVALTIAIRIGEFERRQTKQIDFIDGEDE